MQRVILVIFAVMFARWFHDELTSIVFFLPIEGLARLIGFGIFSGASRLNATDWAQIAIWSVIEK